MLTEWITDLYTFWNDSVNKKKIFTVLYCLTFNTLRKVLVEAINPEKLILCSPTQLYRPFQPP